MVFEFFHYQPIAIASKMSLDFLFVEYLCHSYCKSWKDLAYINIYSPHKCNKGSKVLHVNSHKTLHQYLNRFAHTQYTLTLAFLRAHLYSTHLDSLKRQSISSYQREESQLAVFPRGENLAIISWVCKFKHMVYQKFYLVCCTLIQGSTLF